MTAITYILDERLYSPEKAMKYLRISREKFRALESAGVLQKRVWGNGVKFDRVELDNFISKLFDPKFPTNFPPDTRHLFDDSDMVRGLTVDLKLRKN